MTPLDASFFEGGWQQAATLKMIEEGWSVFAANTAAEIRSALFRLADTGELGTVLRAIEAGDVSMANLRLLDAVRSVSLDDNMIANRLMDSHTHGLRSTQAAFVAQGQKQGVGFEFNFRMLNEESVKWAQERGAELVVEINDVQRSMLRNIVEQGQVQGIPAPRLAQHIRQVVGLHSQWAGAVRNYEQRLLKSGISPAQASTMTDKYAARLRSKRALNIARTETLTAQNRGQLAVWQHLQGLGYIDPNLVSKKWIVTRDDKLCPWCKQMTGSRAIADVDGYFSTPSGTISSPPMHPSCRCAMVLDIVDVPSLMLDRGMTAANFQQWLEPFEKGDYSGHPFRGNQYKTGRGELAAPARPTRAPVPDDAEHGWKVSREMVGQYRVVNTEHGNYLEPLDVNNWQLRHRDSDGHERVVQHHLSDEGALDYIDKFYGHRYDLDQEAKATAAAGQDPTRIRMIEEAQDGRLYSMWEDLRHHSDSFADSFHTYEGFREVVGSALRDYATGTITVNLPATVIDKIVYGDGRIKSQFETDTTGGMYSPRMRASQENEMLGIRENLDLAQRPIYGAIRRDFDGKNGASHYGAVELQFGPEVAARSTVAIGDTLNHSVQPVPVTAVKTASAERMMAAVSGEVDFVANFQVAADFATFGGERGARTVGSTDRPKGEAYRDVFRKELALNVSKSYAEVQVLGQLRVDEATNYKIHAPTNSEWLVAEHPEFGRYTDTEANMAERVLQHVPNLVHKAEPIARRGELVAHQTLDPDVVVIVNENTGELLGEAPWPGAVKFGYWEIYTPDVVAKHGPGNQKPHGNRKGGAGSPGSAPRSPSAASSGDARATTHSGREEAQKAAEHTVAKLAKEFPKTGASVRLKEVEWFNDPDTAARLTTDNKGSTIEWNLGKVHDFRAKHDLEHEPLTATMERIITHEFGHAIHNQAFSTIMGNRLDMAPIYGEHTRQLREPIHPQLKLDYDRSKEGGPTISDYAKRDYAEWFAESFLATRLGIGNKGAITGSYVQDVSQWAEKGMAQPDAERFMQGYLKKSADTSYAIEEDFEGSLVADPEQGDQLFGRLLRKHLKGQHDQSTHGHGGSFIIPFQGVTNLPKNAARREAAFKGDPTKLGNLTPEKRAQLEAHIKKEFGVTYDDLKANIRKSLDLAPDEAIRAGMAWYSKAGQFGKDLGNKTGLGEEAGVGMVAALSPQHAWPSNRAGATYMARALSENWSVTEQVLNTPITKRIGAKNVEVTRPAREWMQEELDHARIKGHKPGEFKVPEPGTKLSEMDSPWIAASVIKAMSQAGYRAKEGDYSTTPETFQHQGNMGIMWSCGLLGMSRATRIARGESVNDVLNGHKVRSFYDDMMFASVDPKRDGTRGAVTVDTHEVSLEVGKKMAATNPALKKGFDTPKDIDNNLNGTYPLFAQAVRDVAVERGMIPHQVQAITWLSWQYSHNIIKLEDMEAT